MDSVTMEDVARAAKVSRALVSLVMRDSPKVSPERREAVLQAARELGYRRNRLASSLASHRTHAVGVLLSDLHNPVFAAVYDGLDDRLRETSQRLLVATGRTDPDREAEAIWTFLDLRVDALVLVGATVPDSLIAEIGKRVPTVVATRQVDQAPVDSVFSDDVTGARAAVDHLHRLGHRDIAHVASPSHLVYHGRRDGYVDRMHELGLEPYVLEGDLTRRGGELAAHRMVDERRVPTAVFAHNDVTAVGVVDALTATGIDVPQDVSVVGYDNSDLAQLGVVSLTSVDLRPRRIGEVAAGLVLERLSGPTLDGPELHRLEPVLFERTSTLSRTPAG
ncbi:LacI family DNA-binding transcriptional regulator [Solicola sp. PLA-1-18]|uniref:LacI family DNA-binding transcriptional regulator n=1 Tax=Solicola sp. PLA-1-18 TaxID=3380532 RepID=UPI003B7693D0